MFMQPIIVPTIIAKKPRPLAMKLTVGLVFMAFSAVLFAPWFALNLLWAGTILGATAIGRAVKSCYQCLVYAGEAIVGR